MIAWVASVLLLIGAGFCLIAALGIVRMPDLYCRMHAATKAGSFGVSLMLLALLVAAPSLRLAAQSAFIILFFYLTAPVAAQMIGRVALQQQITLWKPGRPADEAGDPPADRPGP